MDRRGRSTSSCRGRKSVLIMGFLVLLGISWCRELRMRELRWCRLGCESNLGRRRCLDVWSLRWSGLIVRSGGEKARGDLRCCLHVLYQRFNFIGGTFSIRKLPSRYCNLLQWNLPILYIYASRRRSPTHLVALRSDQWSRLESSIAPKANPCVHVGALSAT
jgi:hypothetical protein